MIWPDFNTTIAFAGSNPIFQLVLQEKCVKNLLEKDLESTLLNIENKDIIPSDGFLHFASWINLYLKEEFIIEEHDNLSTFYNQYITCIEDLFSMMDREPQQDLLATIRAATYSLFYKLHDGKILIFQLHNKTSHVLMDMFMQSMKLVSDLLAGRSSEIANDIENSYTYGQQIYYVGEVNGTWNIIDPLLYVSDEINRKHMHQADLRAGKPKIILQQDNLKRKHSFGGNWALEFDGLSTVLDKPNDVPLYSNICKKNLLAAKKFYEETILIRHKYYTGNFPRPEKQREYFDYFELITTALIFAYSAVEAFLNSFIPDVYIYTKPNGTKSKNKHDIERYFTMTEKFRLIFMDIYNTPDPQQENWWPRLADLQELRDQTIHTKQYYSQTRYSKLLSRDIFDTIHVYKDIITHYGKYIMKKDKRLINDFPYNFGFDQVFPSLMNDRTFKNIYNTLHNPSNPL